MTLTRIWKDHTFPRGKRKGDTKLFVVKPRDKDNKFCVKEAHEKSNRDEVYEKLDTLDEVAIYTRKGWRVRMWCEEIGEWNTLKYEGLNYA
jgi:hypothetical protein